MSCTLQVSTPVMRTLLTYVAPYVYRGSLYHGNKMQEKGVRKLREVGVKNTHLVNCLLKKDKAV